jgi:N6-adenosine-specific RNA methylase IME4
LCSRCSSGGRWRRMRIGEYETHPAANIFPLIQGRELDELIADIRETGVRQPVVLVKSDAGDLVLDGRNRLRACDALGITPPHEYYEGDDPVGYVVSLNLRRRHLNESQRAMVAARIANLREGRPHKTASFEAVSQDAAAELLNVSRSGVQRARAVTEHGDESLQRAVDEGLVSVSAASEVAREPREKQAEIVARGEAEILAEAKRIRQGRTEQRRAERTQKLAEISRGNVELGTDTTYPVIYGDPPWRYQHAESESRAIENQYPTMELDEICALPVRELATPDAVLFLWATSPKLAEALSVVEAWGFTYRTCMVWDKERVGMGYYARQQHELLLIATKGSPPAPAPDVRPPSVIREKRDNKHSKKPARFAELIEAMYPGLPRVELFCRDPREGWAAWGNQADAAE